MCVYDRLFLYNLTFRAPPGHHGLHEKMAPMFVLSSSLFCLSVFVNFPFSITIPRVLPSGPLPLELSLALPVCNQKICVLAVFVRLILPGCL